MKLTTISVAVAAMVVFAQSAQAREHYRHHRYHAAHFARHYSSPGRGDPGAAIMPRKTCLPITAKAISAEITRAKITRTKTIHGTKRLWRPNRCPYRRASGGVVRLGDAAACVRRSGPRVQPGAQLGALGTGRTGRRRRGRGLVAPRRQDRRPGGRRVDHQIRQRRQPGSHPATLARRRHRHSLGMIGSPATLR